MVEMEESWEKKVDMSGRRDEVDVVGAEMLCSTRGVLVTSK